MIQAMGLVILFLMLALSGAGGVIWWQNDTHVKYVEVTAANTATLESVKAEQDATIDALLGQQEMDQARISVLGSKIAVAEAALNTAVSRLDGWRSKLANEALNDPADVQRRTNRAWIGGMLQYGEATGGVRPGGSEADAPANDNAASGNGLPGGLVEGDDACGDGAVEC